MRLSKLLLSSILLCMISISSSASVQEFTEFINKCNDQDIDKLLIYADWMVRRKAANDDRNAYFEGIKNRLNFVDKETKIEMLKHLAFEYPFLLEDDLLVKDSHVQPDKYDFDSYLDSKSHSELLKLANSAYRYILISKAENLDHDITDSTPDDKLKSIIKEGVNSKPELKIYLEEINEKGILTFQEIRSLLQTFDKKKLKYLTINVDQYDRYKSETLKLGGVFEYIWTLPTKVLYEIIVEIIHQNPELAINGALDKIINHNSIYLKYCYTGGMRDYHFDLTNPEIYYIFSQLKNEFQERYPWLQLNYNYRSKEINGLKQMLYNYLIENDKYKNDGVFEEELNFPIHGLAQYLREKYSNDDDLRNLCCSMLSYRLNQKNPPQGTHAIISTMSYNEKINYYIKQTNEDESFVSTKKMAEMLKEFPGCY